MSARKIVVLTTSAQASPAASRTADRFRSERSAWASTPSTSSPVAGSSPSWPGAEERARRSRSPGCTGRSPRGRRSSRSPDGSSHAPVAGLSAGDRGGDDERLTAGKGQLAVGDRRPEVGGGRLGLIQRRIEDPEGRTGARQADRTTQPPAERAPDGRQLGDDDRGGRQEVVGDREDPRPVDQGPRPSGPPGARRRGGSSSARRRPTAIRPRRRPRRPRRPPPSGRPARGSRAGPPAGRRRCPGAG